MKFLNSSFVLLLTVVSSCKMQFDTAVISENKDIILSAQESKFDVKENTFNLVFETDYRNENIQIYSDQSLLFQKVISTDDRTGIAEFFPIKNAPISYLLIKSNKWKIKLRRKQIDDYKYIYFSKLGKKYTVTLSNKPHLYY